MARTLLDLAKQMESLREDIPEAANKLKISVARTIHTDLVFVTPVDTSKALSNWVAHTGEMWALEIDAYVEGDRGSTQEASGNLALQQAEQQYSLSKSGDPIHLTNNADYIRNLNDGSSSQAPAGFVERSEMRGRLAIDRYGLRLNSNG